MSEIPGRLERWWVYQSERFPVVGHGLLIAAFSFSGLSFSHLLRQGLAVDDVRRAHAWHPISRARDPARRHARRPRTTPSAGTRRAGVCDLAALN